MAASPLSTAREAVDRQLEMMSPRDRKMLLGLFVFGTVIFMSFFCYTLYGIVDSKAGLVRSAKADLGKVQSMQVAATDAKAQLVDQENRLRQYQTKKLAAHVEEIATRRGLNSQLRNVNESSSEVVGTLKQTRYKVELKGIDYQDAVGFLYELETSGYPVSVETAVFNTTTIKRELKLNLSLDLIVFSLAEA